MPSIQRFSRYLQESSNVPYRVLKHIEHLEDLLWLEGPQSGITHFENYFSSIIQTLYQPAKGVADIELSIKFDGSPSIICGIHPETKKPFLSTKSLFNSVPKINYTKSDLDINHPHISVLYEIIDCLPQITKGKILHGDLLYTPSMLNSETIDNEDCWTFQPNVIKYVVPKNSTIGKQIATSKCGVVWHTEYRGKSIKELTAVPYAKSSRHTTNDVVCFSTNVKNIGQSLIDSDEYNQMITEMSEIKRMSYTVSEYRFPFSENQLRTLIFPAFNQSIRKYTSVKEFQSSIPEIIHYILNHPKASAPMKSHIQSNITEFSAMLQCYTSMMILKNRMIRYLNRLGSLRSLVPEKDGWKVSSGEGYVAYDIRSGSIFKLVDRIGFSRLNFALNS